MCGLTGSSGKKGCSTAVCSASSAVAILAKGFAVVAMGLPVKRRVRGRVREQARRTEVLNEIMLEWGRQGRCGAMVV